MSAKGPIAGFLVAILLAMSSWSSACDLSCALANRHIGCETGQNATAQKAEAAEAGAATEMDMSHCMHAAGAEDAAPSSDAGLAATSCRHDACRQAAVSTAAKRSAAAPAPLTATAAIFVAATQPLASNGLTQLAEREYPPPKTTFLDPLSLSLRI